MHDSTFTLSRFQKQALIDMAIDAWYITPIVKKQAATSHESDFAEMMQSLVSEAQTPPATQDINPAPATHQEINTSASIPSKRIPSNSTNNNENTTAQPIDSPTIDNTQSSAQSSALTPDEVLTPDAASALTQSVQRQNDQKTNQTNKTNQSSQSISKAQRQLLYQPIVIDTQKTVITEANPARRTLTLPEALAEASPASLGLDNDGEIAAQIQALANTQASTPYFGTGNPQADIMLLSGWHENHWIDNGNTTIPPLLQQALSAIEIAPDQVYCTPFLKYQYALPLDPDDSILAECLPLLAMEIAKVQPRVVVAFGHPLCRYLTQQTTPLWTTPQSTTTSNNRQNTSLDTSLDNNLDGNLDGNLNNNIDSNTHQLHVASLTQTPVHTVSLICLPSIDYLSDFPNDKSLLWQQLKRIHQYLYPP
ncbi:uracil-DNA glycosylase family protein [Ostreibacterium oceani]|nr:uracil-DNA glycosylase family protein [Ostreibacterium oceani]